MLETFKKFGFRDIKEYVPSKNTLVLNVDGDYNDGDYANQISEFEGEEEIIKVLALLQKVEKVHGRINDIVFSDDEDELEDILSDITPFIDNEEVHTIDFEMEYYDNDGIRYTVK